MVLPQGGIPYPPFGGARDPKVPTQLQVADVDTGVINLVNADLVTHIVPRC